MENAAYHSRVSEKALNSNWRKTNIQERLSQNFVSFELDLRKPELLELVRPLIEKLFFLGSGWSSGEWSQSSRDRPL